MSRELRLEAQMSDPFERRTLIEASAGTGKTYTLANLYLRFLLEGRSVEDILVVTFTNAATEELRGRIRQRIRDLIQVLKGDMQATDPALQAYAQSYSDDQTRVRLDDALINIDQASIHTIHGFCQRILQEHAFECGVDFDLDLVMDDSEQLLQVCRDYWRREVTPLPPAQYRELTAKLASPLELLKLVKPFLDGHAHFSDELQQDIEPVEKLEQQLDPLRESLAALWPQAMPDLAVQVEQQGGGLNKTQYKPGWFVTAKDAVTAFLAAEGEFPKQLGWTKLSKATKKGEVFDAHPLYELGDEIITVQNAIEASAKNLQLDFKIRACREIPAAYREYKQRMRTITPDDLLVLVRDALKQEDFARKLAERYPLAMIDEFQDTDPVQYALFGLLTDAGQNLIMIGDPKQAIYAFRGADIFTYLEARRQTQEASRYSLNENWRSTPGVLDGINHLFTYNTAVRDRAFIFNEGIEYQPMRAAKDKAHDELIIPGIDTAPIQFWTVENEGSVDEVRAAIASALAGQIAQTLNQAKTGKARLGDRAVEARDIAILVSSHAQARIIRDALQEHGLGSAYVGKESVFRGRVAQGLLQLVSGIVDCGSASRVRAAVASDLLGLTMKQLEQAVNNAVDWDAWLLRFREWNRQWQDDGFMPMFYSLLSALELPKKLAGQAEGERMLTDLMQLAELIQEADLDHHGMDDVLGWFREQVTLDIPGEEHRIRLESDAQLVRIVTIHASKGLQYPIVYLPYLWSHNKRDLASYHDSEGQKVVAFDADTEAKTLTDRERLAEDLRLLYVALTRAEQRIYCAWGPLGRSFNGTALSWLLHAREEDDAEQQQFKCFSKLKKPEEKFNAVLADLGSLAAHADGLISIQDLPSSTEVFTPLTLPAEQLKPRAFTGKIRFDWYISSYSGLTRGIHHAVDHDVDEGTEEEQPLHVFPRGVRTGNFMHSLLEHIDFADVSQENNAVLVRRFMRRFGMVDELESEVYNWLGTIVKSPLPSGTRLRSIDRSHRFSELDFFFAVERLDTRRLNEILKRWDIPPLSNMQERNMTGLLNGQIDLVYEHEGQYFIVDYKTNDLGAPVNYLEGQLEHAMLSRRYDLQYLIYTIALHRYLQQRISDYDYERHFGGVEYLFLRGMDGTSSNGIYATRPPLGLIQDMEAMLAGEVRDAG
jgi:exodeoxyribonuclease V beta subunit